MKIILNGQEKSLASPITVTSLLQDLGMGEARVAVEINQEIVPRSRHSEYRIQDQDRVEVVRAIGGG